MKSNKIFISKIVASVLAFVLAVSTAFTAFAAIGTDKGKITVKDLEAGATATAYQIMTVSYDTTADQPKSPEYYWTDSMYTWLQANTTYSAYADTDNKSVKEAFSSNLTDAESKAFFADVAAAIKAGTVSAEPKTATNSSTDSTQDVAISNLEMGEYLVLVTGGVNIYQPIAVNVVPKYNEASSEYDMDNPEITDLKNTKPSINKTIPTADDKTVGINDVVSYQLDVTIPSYPTTATAKTFYVNDILSNGLTFNDNVVVYGVKADGTVSDTALTVDTDYTQSTQDRLGNDVTFSLKFDGVALAANDYTALKIEYSATVNKEIQVSTGNGNTATIEYNNNPYEDDSWKDGSSEKTVYTYGLNLTKVDKTNVTKKLGGAEFKLLTDADDVSTAIKFIKKSDGHYRVAVKDATGAYESGATDTIVSGVETATLGQLMVDGLDLGVYYLKETKAPAGGYKIPSALIPLTVKDDNLDGIVDDADLTDKGYLTMNIENTTGFTLPTTGGMGTVIFTVGGVALVALGAAMIIIISKKSKKKA